MNTLFSIEILVGALCGLVFAVVIILILQVRSSTQISKLTFPAYEYVIKQAENKANEIVNEAQKQARAMLAQAEQAGQQTFAHYENSAQSTHDTVVATIENFKASIQKEFTQAGNMSVTKLESLTNDFTELFHKEQEALHTEFDASVQSVHNSSKQLEAKTHEAIDYLEKQVQEVVISLTERMQKADDEQREVIGVHLQEMLAQAEQHIVEYQQSRMGLVDTHVERLVEDVTRRVLHKQLNIGEHADIARQALSEAKEHNIL